MSNTKLSFIIAFIYVVFGTVYAYYIAHGGAPEGLLYYLFIPVASLPQLIMLVERDPIVYIVIGQLLTTLVIAFLIRSVLPIFRPKK
ncbi:MAG: hypothetical protein AAGB22_04965 [Bacteroidota bacterium]